MLLNGNHAHLYNAWCINGPFPGRPRLTEFLSADWPRPTYLGKTFRRSRRNSRLSRRTCSGTARTCRQIRKWTRSSCRHRSWPRRCRPNSRVSRRTCSCRVGTSPIRTWSRTLPLTMANRSLHHFNAINHARIICSLCEIAKLTPLALTSFMERMNSQECFW